MRKIMTTNKDFQKVVLSEFGVVPPNTIDATLKYKLKHDLYK